VATTRWDRSLHADVYRTPAWKATRAAVMARAGGQCESCHKVKPLQAHHILSIRERRDLAFDPNNCIAVCLSCHRKAEHEDSAGQAWRLAPCEISLAIGPPGTDFRAWLRSVVVHRSDLVVDSDMIAAAVFSDVLWCAALSLEDAQIVQDLRQETIRELRAGRTAKRSVRAWLTSSNPAGASFLPWHKLVDLDAGPAAAMLRVESGQIPEFFRPLISRFYTQKTAIAEGYRQHLRSEPVAGQEEAAS
jgi:hypothetical protein